MKNLYILILGLALFSLQGFGQKGEVKGRVFDKSNNEPLPFVNVIIEGTTVGSTTDMDGYFLLTGLKPGFVQLRVSFVGYKTEFSDELQITNAKQVYTEIGLLATSTKLKSIVIEADPFERNDESPVALQKIGLREIESNPGANRDISKVIQSFPGVASTPSFRNDIIIRGGGPSESRFFLDGIEIPTLNHFGTQGSSGGAVGIINADFISSVDYYSGAFPATVGNALSGVFQISQKEGNKEKLRFRGSLGASEMSATFDGPIGEKTTFIFSARRSYLQFLFSALELPFLPTFSDYQLKVKTKINKKNELNIISIGALDQFSLNTNIKNPDESQQFIIDNLQINNQWNYAIGAVWRHYGKNSYQNYIVSRNMLNNSIYKYPENDESQPKSFDYYSQEIENKFRFESVQRKKGWKITYGLGGEYAKYKNETKQQIYFQDVVQQFDYSSYLELFKYNAFGQVTKKFMEDKLTLSVGLRMDANTYSESMNNPLDQLSPRFSFSYALATNTRFIGNVGRYYQLPSYTTLGYRDASGVLVNKENDLKYIQSDHFIAGIEHKLKKNIIFTVEGFYKKYSNYPFSLRDSISLANNRTEFGVLGAEPVTSISEGRAYGVEFLNRTRYKNLNVVLAYTYVVSEFQDKNGSYIPSSWDSRHILTVTASQNLKRDWTVGVKWRLVGGLPYTPYDLEKSAIVEAWDANNGVYADYDQLNTLRYDPFHQLDIRVDKKFYFDKWSLMMYLDIQNAYNFQSESQDFYIRDKDDNGNYILENGSSTYKLKGLNNTSGTVLPTIGIMFEF